MMLTVYSLSTDAVGYILSVNGQHSTHWTQLTMIFIIEQIDDIANQCLLVYIAWQMKTIASLALSLPPMNI